MNILQTLFSVFTTENRVLTNLIIMPLLFIETTITMSFFLTVLNIPSSKKQKLSYIIFASILGNICNNLFSKEFSNLITLICIPISIMYIFKIGFLKSLVAEFLPLICRNTYL